MRRLLCRDVKIRKTLGLKKTSVQNLLEIRIVVSWVRTVYQIHKLRNNALFAVGALGYQSYRGPLARARPMRNRDELPLRAEDYRLKAAF